MRRRPLLDPALLRRGLDALAAADPDVAAARARIGDPTLRRREPGFGTLLDVIVGQQVSTASAAAIRGRLRALVQPLTPARYLETPVEQLVACGLSRQKLAYSLDLARATQEGRVDLERLRAQDDEDAIAHLVSIKGIGRWTAEIYLLFCLGRPDVWPAEDLALQLALQHLKRLDERPRGKVMRRLGDPWSPWRGVAAHFLWHVYHHMTKRVAVPIEPVPGVAPPRAATRTAQRAAPSKPAAKKPAARPPAKARSKPVSKRPTRRPPHGRS